ncbi:uncharacterized protein LTR77_007360 [Saxophila tyrrhenica]|uniref:J domain-containing protein n=1 Tax=Saxophila tyrrhenica TaxID=1690608 RepID=A0AAV9P6F0_9PEZI|nr:hypothetical protein LTR77_007360 [Saxophila tyrrhenica]
MALDDIFDPFEALGLERDASPRTIKARYHELALRYHPNRNQGELSEHFHNIHQAWQLLCDADKRRRCIELLQLFDLQDDVYTNVWDPLHAHEHPEQQHDHKSADNDGHVSSDADDDDLPRIAGIKRRATFERPTKRSTAGLDDIEEGSDSSDQTTNPVDRGRTRISDLRRTHASKRKEDSSSDHSNTAAERMRRLNKLRSKECDAFNEYKEAMVAKFEAELAAQRCKDRFEQARWRRQYYERAPKDGAQRVRLLRLFNSAAKALITHQPVRRRISTKSSARFVTPMTPATGEAQNTGSLLSLPSRVKSIHRRGYSSDVTGDQTSSEEENSSDKNTSPHRSPRASSPRPGRPRHRRWDSNPGIAPLATRSLPKENTNPISPITGPLKVFIRTPTNLAEMAASGGAGSDADSASASSGSTSPQPPALRKNDSGRFVMVPTKGATDMFTVADDRTRSRSPSADRRSISGTTVVGAAEACQFMVKQVGHLQHQNIRTEHVHLLSYQEKRWLLGIDPDSDTDPETLLNRLSRLDQTVATSFVVKPDIKAIFNFRLIYSHHDVPKHRHQTFIALSYRRKLQVEKRHNHFTLPLEPEMFQAVWDERESDTEGIWIDQICIGDTEEEKTISMSAMDMVYRSARMVVVALDDVELDAKEGAILENHMTEFERQVHVKANKRFRRRQTPYLEAKEDLYMVIRKMLRSSWFQRAWCRHEMRLARDHVFLVPCRTPGSWSGKSVLRFTGKCLTHFLALATEVPFEMAIENVKAALYAFFRDRSKLPAHDYHMRSHHGNFTTVVAEVFAMQAGGDPRIPLEQREADARKDKISIILNTMECGLALSPKMRDPQIRLPEHECNYMMLLLALAARDPGALTSLGRPLRQLPHGLMSSWISAPTNVDSGLNNYRTLNRLPETSRISTGHQNAEHFVNLALKFLSADDYTPPPALSSESLKLASHFVDVCTKRKLGRNRNRYLITDTSMNSVFGSMHDMYVQTLACVFECGPLWLSDVCERYGVSRWKHDLQSAYELMIALKNTDGKWPETAWSNQAAGFLMDFVNFLVVRGLPHRGATSDMDDMRLWGPVWVPTINGGRVLTFAPREDVRVAVPVALFDSDYVHLARLWVLKPRGTNSNNEWTLQGKSVLFSDDASMESLDKDNGMIRRAQKVFGRPAKPSMGNVATAALRLRTTI